MKVQRLQFGTAVRIKADGKIVTDDGVLPLRAGQWLIDTDQGLMTRQSLEDFSVVEESPDLDEKLLEIARKGSM